MTSERQSCDHSLVTPTAKRAQELADAFGIRYEKTYGDELAESITRLAGDDVQLDATGQLLIALQRAGKLTPKQVLEMLSQHLDEKEELGDTRVRPVPGL